MEEYQIISEQNQTTARIVACLELGHFPKQSFRLDSLVRHLRMWSREEERRRHMLMSVCDYRTEMSHLLDNYHSWTSSFSLSRQDFFISLDDLHQIFDAFFTSVRMFWDIGDVLPSASKVNRWHLLFFASILRARTAWKQPTRRDEFFCA